jgi:spermidine synthase
MEKYPEYIKKIDNEFWLVESEADSLKIFYKIKDILFCRQSNFQHVMILDSYDFGKMLVLDGIVQTTSADGFIYNEMITHIPMNIHPDPKRVLIIGGGDCGVAKEVARYSEVKQIDMVEIDEMVVKACLEHLPEISGNLRDPKVNFIFEDGLKYVQDFRRQYAQDINDRKNEKGLYNEIENNHDGIENGLYDIVIVDSSDPVGPATSLFKPDFYKMLYNIVKDDGLMACQSESPIFHAKTMKHIYDKLYAIFPITRLYTTVVPTYPGGMWSFILASKKYGHVNPSKFDKETVFVNKEILANCFAIPEFVKKRLDA